MCLSLHWQQERGKCVLSRAHHRVPRDLGTPALPYGPDLGLTSVVKIVLETRSKQCICTMKTKWSGTFYSEELFLPVRPRNFSIKADRGRS